MSLTSLGILGPGGGIVEPTRDATKAAHNYLLRLWKISNHWRNPPTVVQSSSASQKILIVLSDTGGGHKASASSISSALEHLQPDLEVKTVDVIENYTPWFSNRLYNVRINGHLICESRLIIIHYRCLSSSLPYGVPSTKQPSGRMACLGQLTPLNSTNLLSSKASHAACR